MIPPLIRFAITSLCLAGTFLVESSAVATLIGPVYPPPGTLTFTQSDTNNDGSISRAAGETWFFSNVSIATSDITYWGPTNGGIALSMVSSAFSPAEIMSYAPALSDLAQGLVVYTGQTQLPSNAAPVYTRLTLAISNQAGPVPMSLTNATSVGLPADIGAVVRIPSPTFGFQATMHFSASFNPTNSFIPALNFFETNKNGNYTAYSSFSAGFYYDSPPQLVANNSLSINRGASATITPDLLDTTDAGNGPSQLTYQIASGGTGSAPRHGSLLLNGVPLTVLSTFTQADINNNNLIYQQNDDCATNDDFAFNVTDADGGVTPTGTYTAYDFLIVIEQPHLPPVAFNQSNGVPLGGSYFGFVSATNLNCVAHALTYRIVVQGSKGTAVVNNSGTGAFTYTANVFASGADSFEFQVNDGISDAASPGVVNLTIARQPPVAAPGSLTLMESGSGAGEFVATDPNHPSAPITYSIATNGTLGTAVLTNSNTGGFLYTAQSGVFGVDLIYFQASASGITSAPAPFVIFVRPTLNAGNVVVADQGNASVVELDLVGGYALAISSSNLLTSPAAVAIEPAGTILVGDPSAGLVRIDSATGAQTVVASATNFSGLLGAPTGIAVAPDGGILVADLTARIQRFDPVSGVAANLTTGGFLTAALGLCVGDGTVYVTDASTLVGQAACRVVSVNLTNGAQSVILTNFSLPSAITVNASNMLYVCDAPSAFGQATDAVYELSADLGTFTNLTPSSNDLRAPFGVAFLSADQLIVVNSHTGSALPPALDFLTVDASLTPVTLPAVAGLNKPWGVAVVRQKPVFETPVLLPGSAVQLSIDCEPGRFVALQYSSDLQTWQFLATAPAPQGTAVYIDTPPATRFYRAFAY
ncbi:exported hypothetical protein [Verrucomicrobia bacterium]|nr:exported hypothetical protein [Verrucomicrobiota bacterium]